MLLSCTDGRVAGYSCACIRAGSATPYERRRRRSVKLEKDTENYLLNSIKRFFAEELEMDIGDLKAAQVLDFFVGEMGPSIYNQAILDAQAFFTEKVSDLAGVHNQAEFDYWKSR
ncbi:DUF2164 domain-containing protein [bacterium]|nr:DUF2164 domain-containing protein [bacterium]